MSTYLARSVKLSVSIVGCAALTILGTGCARIAPSIQEEVHVDRLSASLAPTTVLAVVDGRPITVADVDRDIRGRSFKVQHMVEPLELQRMRAQALNSRVELALAEIAARDSRAVDVDKVKSEVVRQLSQSGKKTQVLRRLSMSGLSWSELVKVVSRDVSLRLYVTQDLCKGLDVSSEQCKRLQDEKIHELMTTGYVEYKVPDTGPTKTVITSTGGQGSPM